MVHKHFKLVPSFTVARNILLGHEPKKGLSYDLQAARETVRKLSETYGLYVNPDDVTGELSVGLQQRVEILKALRTGAKVLILDEPAAGLDPRGRERILGMLQELHREGGVTIVMVSHSMDDCARLATRMIVMSKGELVLTDTPRNVFRQADLMRSIGLGVPEAAELCGRLRAAGLQLPDDLFTQEELHDHLLRLWKEKQEKEAAK